MKKILLVSAIALLAAGCGSSSTVNGTSDQPAAAAPSMPAATNPTPPTPAKPSDKPTGDVWQTTLMASDNSAKGNYMITVQGHALYLNTSRDYNALVGKPVNVSYTGDLMGFTLNDITAQ